MSRRYWCRPDCEINKGIQVDTDIDNDVKTTDIEFEKEIDKLMQINKQYVRQNQFNYDPDINANDNDSKAASFSRAKNFAPVDVDARHGYIEKDIKLGVSIDNLIVAVNSCVAALQALLEKQNGGGGGAK